MKKGKSMADDESELTKWEDLADVKAAKAIAFDASQPESEREEARQRLVELVRDSDEANALLVKIIAAYHDIAEADAYAMMQRYRHPQERMQVDQAWRAWDEIHEARVDPGSDIFMMPDDELYEYLAAIGRRDRESPG
jgi:hypothetical protein